MDRDRRAFLPWRDTFWHVRTRPVWLSGVLPCDHWSPAYNRQQVYVEDTKRRDHAAHFRDAPHGNTEVDWLTHEPHEAQR
jgi:hypothetical protein